MPAPGKNACEQTGRGIIFVRGVQNIIITVLARLSKQCFHLQDSWLQDPVRYVSRSGDGGQMMKTGV